MKRPQGFDKPAAPVATPSPAETPAKAPRRGFAKLARSAAATPTAEPVSQGAPVPAREDRAHGAAVPQNDETVVIPTTVGADPARRPSTPASQAGTSRSVVSPSTAPTVPPAAPRAQGGTSSAAFADARSSARAEVRPGALPTAWWTAKNAAQTETGADAIPPARASIAEAATEPITVVGAAQGTPVGTPVGAARDQANTPAGGGPTAESTGPLAPVTQLNTATLNTATLNTSTLNTSTLNTSTLNTATHNTAAHLLSGSAASSGAGNAGSVRDETPADGAPSPGSARARLRAATRARRAYERAEVRRFTKHLRRRRAAWIGGLGAALALALFVAVGTFSPLMALTTIQIEGTNRLDAVQVRDALSGQIGTPLPLVDLGEIKNDLSQFALVQSFSTESRPPNTLVVRVVERDPIGAIAGPNGFDLVDPAGVVIQTTPERPEGYPLVEAAGAEGLAAAGSVVQALPVEIRAQLDVVKAASTDDVNLVLVGGTSIAWGSAEDSAGKALVLTKLMAAVPAGDVSMYDVSSPASPVVR